MTSLSHIPMAEGAEFDAIRRLLEVWGPAAVGIGDDAAVLNIPRGEQLVVSTDASVENVHFRREWLSSEEIGARATAAALSDLAAMAATPRGLLLALALPDAWRDQLEALARGVRSVAVAAACPVIGGNITSGAELSLTITVLGSTSRPLTRSGAQPGDVVFVTGLLGGPAAALRELYGAGMPMQSHRVRLASPVPRLHEARWLAEEGARAGIDISDGLVGDARQLARASAVSIRIDSARVPCIAGVTARAALTGGEEYELLVAMPPNVSIDSAAFAERFGVPITAIGVVEPAGAEAVTVVGERVDRGGFDHLA